ncbi:hypothetical protein AVEN_59079-1, partial [Araneus ventricosus]
MITPTEGANCVCWYFETKSIFQVQGKAVPCRNSILSGSVLGRPRSGGHAPQMMLPISIVFSGARTHRNGVPALLIFERNK